VLATNESKEERTTINTRCIDLSTLWLPDYLNSQYLVFGVPIHHYPLPGISPHAALDLEFASQELIYVFGRLTFPRVTSMSHDDACSWTRFAEHFPEVVHEGFRPLIGREVPTGLVLRLKHDIPLGTQ
jgi:hypothetical protein